MSEEATPYGTKPRNLQVKPEPREFKSLEIALFAALWTAFSMTISAGVMAVLLIHVLPAKTTPQKPATPTSTLEVKAVKIRLTFDVQDPDGIKIPVQPVVIPQKDALAIPVKVNLKVATKVVQAPAEPVALLEPEAVSGHAPQKLREEPKQNKKYNGVGIPPKKGDRLPPPKGLTHAARRRIDTANSETKKELLTPKHFDKAEKP